MDFDAWLRSLRLERYIETFRENAIDFDVLADLTEADLKELGVALGDRKRLTRAIGERSAEAPDRTPSEGPVPATEAERRHLTVMFVDLVDSTELSAQLDPEEMRDVIRAYQSAVTREVAAFDGYVAKYMGDGVLAYFGFPKAHEDDAERSVRAGLAVTRAVAEIATPHGRPLSARVGVATGVVVVGELVGEAEARERDVVGETPNLAARLQAFARPGRTVISNATRELVGDLFHLEPLDLRKVKGIPGTVEAFLVHGEQELEDRFVARSTGRIAEMVGRGEDLATLIDLWAKGRQGDMQGVLLLGAAGVGKSRLAHALAARIAPEPHLRITLQCAQFQADTALYPIIQRLRQTMAKMGSTADGFSLQALENFFSGTVADASEAAVLLARLLGIDLEDRRAKLDIASQERRSRTLQVLTEHFCGLAATKPLLLVVEDLHWIDPTSLDLLGRMLTEAQNARMLIVLTCRPDGVPDLPALRNLPTIALDRLDEIHSAAIVEKLCGGMKLPPELTAEIVAKTDGVPLFVEEATKMVLATGMIEEVESGYRLVKPLGSISVPSSLRDLLMARLDKHQSVKQVAQAAACIGRAFSRPVLRVACGMADAELDRALLGLENAELIHRRSDVENTTYIFNHALVCDAAYGSLLRSRRQVIHGRIIEALEASSAAPEVLAHHYERAGQPEAAANSFLEAGRNALDISAGHEAIAHLKRGLDLVAGLPTSKTTDRIKFRLYALLGTSYMLIRSWGADEVEQSYATALSYSDAAEDVREKIWLNWGIWVFRQVRGELDACHGDALRIAEIAEASHDIDARLVANMVQMQVAFYRGRLQDSISHGDAIERLYDPIRHDVLKDSYSLDLLLVWRVHAAQGYWLCGDYAAATAALAAANARADSLDHAHSKAWATVWNANLYLMADHPQAVFRTVPEAVENAERRGFDYVSRLGRLMLAAAGLVSKPRRRDIREIERAIAAFGKTGAAIVIPYFNTLKASAFAALGDADSALETIETVLADIETKGERWSQALALLVKGDALASLGVGHASGAAACYREAAKVATAQGAEFWRCLAELRLVRAQAGHSAKLREQSMVEKLDTARARLQADLSGSEKGLGP